MAVAEPRSVEETSTLHSENVAKLPIRSVGKSTTHIKYHWGVGNGWWVADHVLQAQQRILGLLARAPLRAAA